MFSLVLAGCGHAIGPAEETSVTASIGPFHAVASPARLTAGGKVDLKLTVTGPIDYETGCVQTLHVWVEDSRRSPVWEEPVPAIQCMALARKSLAAGETAAFTAQWPTSSRLAAGAYTIHGLFLMDLPPGAGMRVRENLPPLTIEIFR